MCRSRFHGAIARRLKRLPLVHQIADLPHEGLMAVDNRLGGRAIVVEAGSRHRLLQFPDRGFALGDSRFEVIDTRTMSLQRALPLARLGIGFLLLFMGWDR